MTGQPLCYGVRRLNPFQGMLQVVELGDARALSTDGVRWEIQVRCAQPEQPWSTPGQGEPVMRYLRFGWFERDADGGGREVESAGAKGESATPRLTAESFPSLLLRETWPKSADRDLVRDYLDWCAPFLLMLPGIDDRMRDRLERAARARALEVDARYRLYPRVLNTGLLESIRVEARMRQARIA